MEDSEMIDEDADESVEDYFGMSPDWYVKRCVTLLVILFGTSADWLAVFSFS